MKFGAALQTYPPAVAWMVFTRADGRKTAKCGKCGRALDVAKYGSVCSLPLACPSCRTKMRGFSMEKEDGKDI